MYIKTTLVKHYSVLLFVWFGFFGYGPSSSAFVSCQDINLTQVNEYRQLTKGLEELNIKGVFSEIGAGQGASKILMDNGLASKIAYATSAYSTSASNNRYGEVSDPTDLNSYTTRHRLLQILKHEFQELGVFEHKRGLRRYVVSNIVKTSRTDGTAWLGLKGQRFIDEEPTTWVLKLHLKDPLVRNQKRAISIITIRLLRAFYLNENKKEVLIKGIDNILDIENWESDNEHYFENNPADFVLMKKGESDLTDPAEVISKINVELAQQLVKEGHAILINGKTIKIIHQNNFIPQKSSDDFDYTLIPLNQGPHQIVESLTALPRKEPKEFMPVSEPIHSLTEEMVRKLNETKEFAISVSELASGNPISQLFFSQPFSPIYESFSTSEKSIMTERYGRSKDNYDLLLNQLFGEYNTINLYRAKKKMAIASNTNSETAEIKVGVLGQPDIGRNPLLVTFDLKKNGEGVNNNLAAIVVEVVNLISQDKIADISPLLKRHGIVHPKIESNVNTQPHMRMTP
jgi:hypothetical protein